MIKKFSTLNESKIFMVDPSIVKKYASFIIPLYLNGKLKCDENLIDEYLEMNKKSVKSKNANIICDLEILAVKNIFDSPIGQSGYENLEKEIAAKCPKLEKFLRNYITDSKFFI